jgi:hypothetical protein
VHDATLVARKAASLNEPEEQEEDMLDKAWGLGAGLSLSPARSSAPKTWSSKFEAITTPPRLKPRPQ